MVLLSMLLLAPSNTQAKGVVLNWIGSGRKNSGAGAKYPFRLSECVIRKTISLGVTEFSSKTEGFWQCIKFADLALYKAKESGRNKSVMHSCEPACNNDPVRRETGKE